MELQWRCIGAIERGPAVKLIRCSAVSYRRGSKSTCASLHRWATIGLETHGTCWLGGQDETRKDGQTAGNKKVSRHVWRANMAFWALCRAGRSAAPLHRSLALFSCCRSLFCSASRLAPALPFCLIVCESSQSQQLAWNATTLHWSFPNVIKKTGKKKRGIRDGISVSCLKRSHTASFTVFWPVDLQSMWSFSILDRSCVTHS